MLLSAAGLLLAASPAAAAQPPEAAGASPDHAAAGALLARRITDTIVDRFGAFTGEQFQISSGTDNDTLTFRAQLPVGPSQMDTFSLVATAPFHRGGNALPASLDSLANGSTLTLRFGHFDLPIPQPDSVAIDIRNQAVAACEKALASTPQLTRCNDSNFAVHGYALSRYREYLWHTLPTGALDWGIDATAGINDFEWLDPATRGQHRERHTDWSLAGHLAYYLPGTAITATASFQRAYKAADEQLLCPPNTANPATDCVNARGAPPSRNDHFVIAAGLRHRFTGPDGALLSLAVAPQLNYDVLDNVLGVDVPVYFIPGPDGGLSGGVRFGYRSDHDNHYTVAAFMGLAFNLLQ